MACLLLFVEDKMKRNYGPVTLNVFEHDLILTNGNIRQASAESILSTRVTVCLPAVHSSGTLNDPEKFSQITFPSHLI